MYLLGYSLDNLSLMALTLAVGFVVDDAIVVLENIVRHIEQGEPVLEAAIKGSREIGFTVISMTISLVAVFIPVLFLGGLIGRLFQEFAVTIGVAILVSGFVSLTLTPMLCSRWLKPHDRVGAARPVLPRRSSAPGSARSRWYERTLGWVMDHRRLRAGVQRADPGRHRRALPHRAQGLHPERGHRPALRHDRDGRGHQLRRDGASTSAPRPPSCRRIPTSTAFMSAVGGGGRTSTVNQGRLIIHLKTARRAEHERRRGGAGSLSQKLAAVPGMRVFIQNPPVIHIGGRVVQEPVPVHAHQLRHRGALRRAPARWSDGCTRSPASPTSPAISRSGTRRCRSRSTATAPSALGIDVNQIESALYNAYGARQVTTIYTPNNQYWVMMELLPEYQRDLSALNLLHITGRAGRARCRSAASPR